MSSNKSSHYRGARGGGRGRNSNTASPNLERGPSRRPTTSPLDTTSATHDADSPRNPEGDNIDPPVTPSLEATDIQGSEQPPTANESVEQLVYKLTTPTPLTLTTPTTVPTPPPTTVDDSSSYVPGFAPIEPEKFPDDEDVDNIVFDDDEDDVDPVASTVAVDRPPVRPKVRTRTRQDGPKPKDRRVSDRQSDVNSAELLWYNQIYADTFEVTDEGTTYAIRPITLSTGLTLRPGDFIPSDAADLHVQFIQDNTQHAKRQRMLAAYMVPAAKAPRVEDVATKATTSIRRRHKEDDDKSVSDYGDEHSIASLASISSNRRAMPAAFNTPDPADKTRPMPSPITSHQGQFPFRREHVNTLTAIPELLPTLHCKPSSRNQSKCLISDAPSLTRIKTYTSSVLSHGSRTES
jgi:hypothetical protein